MVCEYNSKKPGKQQHTLFLNEKDRDFLLQIYSFIKYYYRTTGKMSLDKTFTAKLYYGDKPTITEFKQLGAGAYGSVIEVSFRIVSQHTTVLVLKLQKLDKAFKKEIDVFSTFTKYNNKYNIPHMQSLLYHGEINNKVGVMITEKAAGSVDNLLKTSTNITKNFSNFYGFVLQLLTTIYIHTNINRIHCDMHLGNFLVYDTMNTCGYWKYEYAEGKHVLIPNLGFYIVSHDFGLVDTCCSKNYLYDYFRAFSSHAGLLQYLRSESFGKSKRGDFIFSHSLVKALYNKIAELCIANLKPSFKKYATKPIKLFGLDKPNTPDWDVPIFRKNMIKNVNKKKIYLELLSVCKQYEKYILKQSYTNDRRDIIETYVLY